MRSNVSVFPHIHPTRKLLSRPVRWRGVLDGVSRSIGPGLCGILDLDFGELLFHALG
jgi:hypothetical protein